MNTIGVPVNTIGEDASPSYTDIAIIYYVFSEDDGAKRIETTSIASP